MDLSVLQSDDPAGYKVEAALKAAAKQQGLLQERSKKAQGTQQNPGSISAADSGQFHLYRKARRHELERLKGFEDERIQQKLNDEFVELKARKLKALEQQQLKKRQKRQKRKNAHNSNANANANDDDDDVKAATRNAKVPCCNETAKEEEEELKDKPPPPSGC